MKFYVWEPVNMEEGDAVLVETRRAGADFAATQGAERIDRDSGGETFVDSLGNLKTGVRIHVRDEAGALHLFDVSSYVSQHYMAQAAAALPIEERAP